MDIEREIEVDLPADQLWELIGTAEGWQRWLVDHAAVVVAAGAEGEVVDDGDRRTVRVVQIDAGRGVTFEWESADRPGDRSVVSLRIVDDEHGARLHVTESWSAAAACAGCPLRAGARWDLRECVLCLGALAACPV